MPLSYMQRQLLNQNVRAQIANAIRTIPVTFGCTISDPILAAEAEEYIKEVREDVANSLGIEAKYLLKT